MKTGDIEMKDKYTLKGEMVVDSSLRRLSFPLVGKPSSERLRSDRQCSHNDGLPGKVIHGMWRSGRPEILNQKGIALAMTLIVSVIALAVMAGLIYMLTAGTQVSGVLKRYNTSLEAGLGALAPTWKLISDRAMHPDEILDPVHQLAIDDACKEAKFNNPYSEWPPECKDDDMLWTFTLGDYEIHGNITFTTEGNSGPGSDFYKGGVVEGGASGGEIAVYHIPYYYTLQIEAVHVDNPAERTKLQVLYQY